MIIDAKNIDEAAGQLKYFARYKPYQYSGKWFVVQKNDSEYFCFRTKKSLVRNIEKNNITNCPYSLVI